MNTLLRTSSSTHQISETLHDHTASQHIGQSRNNAVGIFIDHDSIWIHAEGTDTILKLLGTVDDLALIQFIRQMGEDDRREFHTYTNIYTVRAGWYLKFPTDLFHPFAAASSY